VHSSRRPLGRLTLTLTLTFDLIFIDGRGIVMDYLCAKFGDFSFSRFGFIVRTDRITAAGQRYRGPTHTVCVNSNWLTSHDKPIKGYLTARASVSHFTDV